MECAPDRTALLETALYDHAPAKINLTLGVLGRRPDGYHALHSLVAFARCGDGLMLTPSGDGNASPSLRIAGSMAEHLPLEDDNLILKAARGFRQYFPHSASGHFTLTKRLPVASGIGGGSSDAASALRLLARLNRIPLDSPALYALAATLGSDVPVCLAPQARWMSGRGEELAPVRLPPLWAVLVNPRVAVATASVFKAWSQHTQPSLSLAPAQPSCFSTPTDVYNYMRQHGNDLEPPACQLVPLIAQARDAVAGFPACRIARMSGSGATVFGLFDTRQCAHQAALELKTQFPQWWVVPTVLR